MSFSFPQVICPFTCPPYLPLFFFSPLSSPSCLLSHPSWLYTSKATVVVNQPAPRNPSELSPTSTRLFINLLAVFKEISILSFRLLLLKLLRQLFILSVENVFSRNKSVVCNFFFPLLCISRFHALRQVLVASLS